MPAMKIEIKKVDINNDEHIRSIMKWDNSDDLYHFINPFKYEDKRENLTFESVKKRYKKNPDNMNNTYIILDGDKPIGNFSIQMNPEHLMKKGEETSWIGLTIGEKEYWGTGVAKIAMNYVEKESRKLKAVRIELGTFEFNRRAYTFYKKCGFVEIGKIKRFTYWDGKYWDDIRMEKYLSPLTCMEKP